MAPFSSPVMLNDRVYVIDDSAKMTAFDAKTGEVVAKKKLGSVMRGTGDESPTPFVADGKIYAITGDGQWYVLKPTENEIKVLRSSASRAKRSMRRRSFRMDAFT